MHVQFCSIHCTSTSGIALFCVLVFLVGCFSGCDCSEAEAKLLKELTDKNLKTRPVPYHTDTVHVMLGAALRQIVDVDEIGEKLVVSMWRRLKWTDYRLTWNETEYEGIESVVIPLSDIWTPDVVLYNSVQKEDDPPANAVVSVTSTGKCSYYPFGVYSSQCPMDIRWFPMDDQFCKLDFVSWSYDSNKLNLTMQQEMADLSYFKSSTEWDLMSVTAKVELVKYECCEIPYSFVSYTIHLRRKVLYYVFNLIVPCALISFITCLAFFLPIDSGERAGLCITTLLALTVYQIIVLDRIPASSESAPLIGIFFITLILINTAAMLMTLLVINLHHRTGMFYRRPPVWVRTYICHHLARFLFTSLHRRRISAKYYHSAKTHRHDEFYASRGRQSSSSSSTSKAPPMGVRQPEIDYAEEQQNCEKSPKEICQDEAGMEDQSAQEDEIVEREWKYTALVLDRACFFFFIFVLLFSSACIFLSVIGKE